MARNAEMLPKDLDVWEMESDLPSLASQAAIEIDNLAIGQDTKLDAVDRLGSTIASSVTNVSQPSSPNSPLNASTVVALNLALNDSQSLQLTQLDDLLRYASQMTDKLRDLVRDPMEFKKRRPEELKELRSFCLALSRWAATLSGSIADRPEHPFRR